MRGEAANIELPVYPSMDITKSNQRTRRCVTCYNFTVVFGMVVSTVIKSIVKENLRPGHHMKIQSIQMNSRNDMASSTTRI